MEFSRDNSPRYSPTPIKLDGVEVSAINSKALLVSANDLNPLSENLIKGIKGAAEASREAKIVLDLSGITRLPKDLRETIFGLWGERKLLGIVGKEMLEGQPKEALAPLTSYGDLKTAGSIDALLTRCGIDRGSIAEQMSALEQIRDKISSVEDNRLLSQSAFGSSFREELADPRPPVKISELASGVVKINCVHSRLVDGTKAMVDFCSSVAESAIKSKGNVHLDISKAAHLGSEAFGAILAADRYLDERGKRLIVEGPSEVVLRTLQRMGVDKILEIKAA